MKNNQIDNMFINSIFATSTGRSVIVKSERLGDLGPYSESIAREVLADIREPGAIMYDADTCEIIQ